MTGWCDEVSLSVISSTSPLADGLNAIHKNELC